MSRTSSTVLEQLVIILLGGLNRFYGIPTLANINKYNGTQDEVCRQLKIFLTPVVYATDRSKVVVLVFFLILCGFVVYTTGRLMF